MDTVKATVTNEHVARQLGLSESMVSRLRSGDRQASFGTMQTVSAKLGWTIEAQSRSRAGGRWYLDFEEILGQRYGDGVVVKAKGDE